MNVKASPTAGPSGPGAFVRRRAAAVSDGQLVRERPLHDGGTLPLVIEPTTDGIDLASWARDNLGLIHSRLRVHGGILFRNFGVETPAELERFIGATSSGEWAEYREAATPRSAVSENIFTSTEYPPEQTIYLHNENSHCTTWPLKIYFACSVPAEQGGATPIADCRRVLRRIPAEIRERFIAKGWMYVRNFGQGLGFTWQEVFQAGEPAAVEEYCRRNGMVAQWQGDRLRVRYVRDATAVHPQTGEEIWFNHGTFFHPSTLAPEVREVLLAHVELQDLPYLTYYGDGSEIEPEVMAQLRRAYDEETVRFPWQRGDLLMLDNMLVAHGREPFAGPRKVIVGMAEPYPSRGES